MGDPRASTRHKNTASLENTINNLGVVAAGDLKQAAPTLGQTLGVAVVEDHPQPLPGLLSPVAPAPALQLLQNSQHGLETVLVGALEGVLAGSLDIGKVQLALLPGLRVRQQFLLGWRETLRGDNLLGGQPGMVVNIEAGLRRTG